MLALCVGFVWQGPVQSERGPLGGLVSAEPQPWWCYERAVKGRCGPASDFSSCIFPVGAVAGHFQFWSWTLARVREGTIRWLSKCRAPLLVDLWKGYKRRSGPPISLSPGTFMWELDVFNFGAELWRD